MHARVCACVHIAHYIFQVINRRRITNMMCVQETANTYKILVGNVMRKTPSGRPANAIMGGYY